jgi:hypothetical protein
VLGFWIAFLCLDSNRSPHRSASLTLTPLVLAALPLVDAALTVIRRALARVSPLAGDRSHSYDLTLARGWSSRRVALACHAITGFLGIVAWFGLQSSSGVFLLLAGLSVAGLLASETRLGALRSQRPNTLSDQPPGLTASDQAGTSP